MSTSRFVRSAGLWLVVGALIQLVSASVQAVFPVPPGSSQFVLRNVIVAISHVPVLIGMFGLALGHSRHCFH
jgi:Mg/Co/Ni transporter MgtE